MSNHSHKHKPLYPYKLDTTYTLRRLRARDASSFFNFVEADRPHLEKYDPFFKEFTGIGKTKEILRKIEDLYDQGKSLSCGIWEKDVMIGYFICGLIFDKKAAEPGYAIAKTHEGKGIIHRTGKVVLDYVFNVLNFDYAWVTMDAGNEKSINTAKRLGFKKESYDTKTKTLKYVLNRPH